MNKVIVRKLPKAIAGIFIFLILTGCGKEEAAVSSGAIGFKLSTWEDNSTKATPVATGSFPADSYIGVFGYLCATGSWTGTETPSFIYNTKLNTDGSYCSNDDIVYWPDSPATVQFIAYYPYEKQTWEYAEGEKPVTPTYSILTTKDQTGPPSLVFTTAESPSDQIDLLGGASSGPIHTPGSPVQLTFRHLLSKVGVFVKVDSSTPANTVLTINSLSILNWYQKARFNLVDLDWDSYSNKTDYLFVSSDKVVSSASYENMLGDNEYMMLIPQSLSEVSIQGIYTVTTTVDGVSTSTQFTKTRSLYGMSDLTISKSLNMYFNFNPNLDAYLDISITLSNWTENGFTTTIE